MSREGDLDSTEGHSQLLVGTLPLTDKDPPENPEDKGPPPNPPVEGLASGTSENNTSDLSRDKKSDTTPPTEKSEQVVGNPPLPQREDSPSEYPPQDQSETPLDSEEGLQKSPLLYQKVLLKKIHFQDFGQEKQLMHLTRTKRDIGG